MRTEVAVTAHADGRLDFSASGALTARPTGPCTVHLVGTAAGPLDGDTLRVVLRVLVGARLQVRTVAASVVLAGVSQACWELHVAAGGVLELVPEPTIVTALAVHRSQVRAILHDEASLLVTERVQLGRAGEEPGRWTGSLHVDRGGQPLLRHQVNLGPGSPGHDHVDPGRCGSTARIAQDALVSTLRVPDDARAGVSGQVVVLPLARGGTLTVELRQREQRSGLRLGMGAEDDRRSQLGQAPIGLQAG